MKTNFYCLLLTLLTSAGLLGSTSVSAQGFRLKGASVTHWEETSSATTTAARQTNPLAKNFKRYDIFNLEVEELAAYVKASGGRATFTLQLGNQYNWTMEIEPENLFASDAKGYVLTESGKQEFNLPTAVAYKGILTGNAAGKVRLTISDKKIAGYVTVNNQKFYLENLRNLDKAAQAANYIVYDANDVVQEADQMCQAMKDEQAGQDVAENVAQGRAAATCDGWWQNEMATFAAYNRFSSAGGLTEVNNEILTILNNVQGNYDQFKVKLVVVEQVVSSCSTCDPWAAPSSPSNLLSSFTSWGPTGFTKTHDQGVCFYDGSGSGVVGVAWLSAICTKNRYAVCDKLRTAEANRVLVAHEMGHNFGSGHDASGSGFIMAPSVNAATQWSTASQGSITNHIASRTCLACIGDTPTPTTPTPTPAACTSPANLSVESVQETSASLNWNDASSATTDYTVQVKPVSSSTWQSYSTTTSNLTVTGLQADVAYQWQVSTVCASASTAFTSGPNFTPTKATTPPTPTPTPTACSAPSGMTANVSASAAVFSWQAVPGASTYRARIRVVGASTWRTTLITNKTTMSTDPTRFAAGKTYEWQIRTTCKDGSVSAYANGPTFSGAVPAALLAATTEPAVHIAPNPSARHFVLRLHHPTTEFVDVDVINLSSGKVVQRYAKHRATEPLTLGERLPAGVYSVRVQSSASVHVVKVIKTAW